MRAYAQDGMTSDKLQSIQSRKAVWVMCNIVREDMDWDGFYWRAAGLLKEGTKTDLNQADWNVLGQS